MEQKCSELTDYLHLLQKGNKRSAEDDKRYLQYTNEFKREDTNFLSLIHICIAERVTNVDRQAEDMRVLMKQTQEASLMLRKDTKKFTVA